MPISWNEIRTRSYTFVKEWSGASREEAEAQSFWNDFFEVFGVSRRKVNATFEKKVHMGQDRDGYIDLLWKGIILVEHKSRGKSLDKAYDQATGYFPGLKDNELPRYILVSDFARFRLYDLEDDRQFEFAFEELPNHIELFGFIAGYQKKIYSPQDPVNIKAAIEMGKLYDHLKEEKYSSHELEIFLVRLLFCLFADDTGIFEKGQFRDYIESYTREDGKDLGYHLQAIFDTLDTPHGERQTNIDPELSVFPFINGSLFEKRLRTATFDSGMRKQLLDCSALDWSRISPAIFGSLFQSVMNPEERRSLGAHYTSEENILKVIEPLFLDELRTEFEKNKHNKRKLQHLHDRIATIRIMDPACGCGNFLVIAYRELRMLEIEILKIIQRGQQVLDITRLSKIDVDQFYGIEIEEFPSQIAQVALWMMDHQMNMMLSKAFGLYYARLPLRTKPGIVHGNALTIEWADIVHPRDLTYIIGNPPFIGSKMLSEDQRHEMKSIFSGYKNVGILDYVAAWYMKAAKFIQATDIKVAYVSTKSITHGEQVAVLWKPLINKYGLVINFAHRNFKWTSEAKGKAAVHCVIIGFSLKPTALTTIFDYERSETEAHRIDVKRINPYLVDAPDVMIDNRSRPICDVPSMGIGNKPIDGGRYIFSEEEKTEFLNIEPEAKELFRKFLGASELINGQKRYILWLGGAKPSELRKLPMVMKRIAEVKKFRENSKSAPTRKLAQTPTRYHVENIPNEPFIAVPKTSSISRNYIPIAILDTNALCSDALYILPKSSLYLFGVLISSMHMAWTRLVGGRLKSDYRYSVGIVYNNFPWPELSEKSKKNIEDAAENVITIRDKYPNSSLADLYNPLTMPVDLVTAHNKLDVAVEKAYGRKFSDDADRVSFLFDEYVKFVNAGQTNFSK